ncbi:MAG: DUF4214 domain-containing protein [Acidimicrobiales bacterium]
MNPRTDHVEHPRARRRRAVAAAITTALVAAGVALVSLSSTGPASAAPGDALTSFATNGVLGVPGPSPCAPCTGATSHALNSRLATAGSLVIHGYEWATPVGAGPETSAPPEQGAALAVSNGGAAPWVHQLGGTATGVTVRVLAVGYQPTPARIVAVVGLDAPGANPDDPGTSLGQEIRRYSTAGDVDTTTSLPAATNGSWQTAAVAPDGSVVGVESGSTGSLELPADTIRRYDASGALRWTRPLPTGDGIEAVEVSSTGRVVVVGSTANTTTQTYDGLVAAFAESGSLDPSFGSGGRIVSSAPATEGRSFTELDVVGDQVAVVGRDDWQPPPASDANSDEGPGALLTARIGGGQLLASYSGDGIAEQRWNPDGGSRIDPAGVVLDGNRVVVAGASTEVDGGQPGAVLVRRSADGSIDDTFNADATVATEYTALAAIGGGYLAATPSDTSSGTFTVQLRAYRADGGPVVGPSVPVAPTVSNPHAGSVHLAWPAPSGSPTGYDVLIDKDLDGDVDITSHLGAVTSTDAVGLAGGRAYRFALRARNASGSSARSAWSSVVIPPFSSLDGFTDRQYRDFAGQAATSAQLAQWRTDLASGALTPVAAVRAATAFAYTSAIEPPVIRLYRAYFLRLPDRSGLAYWVGKYRSGTKLNRISASFAGSSEFKRRYGSLSNRAFVDLVYQNVLGRPGEATGVDFWVRQLDTRRRDRGQVMVNFSESSEYRRKSKDLVDVVVLYAAMLGRPPTQGEADLWLPVLAQAGSFDPVTEYLMSTADYDARTS